MPRDELKRHASNERADMISFPHNRLTTNLKRCENERKSLSHTNFDKKGVQPLYSHELERTCYAMQEGRGEGGRAAAEGGGENETKLASHVAQSAFVT